MNSSIDPQEAEYQYWCGVCEEVYRIDTLSGLERAAAFVEAYEKKGHRFLIRGERPIHQIPKGWDEKSDLGYAIYFKQNYRDDLVQFLKSQKREIGSYTAYTMGYLSNWSEKKLKDLIALHVPVVDVRFEPNSKHWQWTKDTLEQKQDLVYYWIKDLGNVNYQAALRGTFTEQRIQIRDMDAGIERVASILENHKKVCLLCACNGKDCHRFVVANEIEKRLGARVVHI